MSDQQIDVKIIADSSGVAAGINDAVGKIQTGMKEAGSSFEGLAGVAEGAFKKINVALAAVAATLAGGAMFKKAVDETLAFTGEANKLAKQLGITSDEASALNIAIGDVYGSSEQFLGANAMLTRQVRTNEQAINAMGLATRDASGNLKNSKDLMMDAIQVINGYKEGTDRNMAAQALFGRGASELGGILKMTNAGLDDAKAKQEALGLTVGEKSVQAARSYKAAMNDVGDVMQAIQKHIGDAVMPTLTRMAQWFADVMPPVVRGLMGIMQAFADLLDTVANITGSAFDTVASVVGAAADIVMSAFGSGGKAADAMQFWRNVLAEVKVALAVFEVGFKEVFSVIGMVVEWVMTGFVTFAKVANAALRLDWDGAVKAAQDGQDRLSAITEKGINKMLIAADEGRAKMDKAVGDAYNPQSDKGKAKSSKGKKFEDPKQPSDTGAKDKSRMGEWDAELQDRKIAYEKANDLREMSKQAEIAYWQEVISSNDLSSKEVLAIHRKISVLELASIKDNKKERDALARQQIDADRQIALDELAVKQQELSSQKALGQISAQEEITAKKKLEDEKFKIEMKATADRAALLPQGSVEQKAAFAQIEALKRQHGLAMQKLNDEQAQAEVKSWQDRMQPINQAFGQSIQGIVMGTTTMQKALANIWQSIGLAFAQMATKMVTDWGAAQLAKLTASRAASATTVALDKVGQVSSTTAAIGAASVEVPAKAAGAASGAASAVAPIPIVGPGMAAAAFASVMAMVLGAKSIIPSAAGGFDIPSGVNPLTQLHEREMVLPAKHADVIRSMAEGVGGGSSQTISFSISAVDSRSVQRLLMDNGGSLVDSIKAQARNFRTV